MPIYSYRCKDCEHVTTRRQGYDADTILDCEVCFNISKRIIISPPVVIFKGDGYTKKFIG